ALPRTAPSSWAGTTPGPPPARGPASPSPASSPRSATIFTGYEGTAPSPARGRIGRSAAARRASPAQCQVLGPLHVSGQHGSGLERDRGVDGNPEGRRRAGDEAEPIGDAPPGEGVHPDQREPRLQAQWALVTACPWLVGRNPEGAGSVAPGGQGDGDRPVPGAIGVQPEHHLAVSNIGAVDGPAGWQLRDAWQPCRRGHGQRGQDHRAPGTTDRRVYPRRAGRPGRGEAPGPRGAPGPPRTAGA